MRSKYEIIKALKLHYFASSVQKRRISILEILQVIRGNRTTVCKTSRSVKIQKNLTSRKWLKSTTCKISQVSIYYPMRSRPNRYQIGRKTCYIPKVNKFSEEKGYHSNRLEEVFYIPKYNIKRGGPHGIEL